MTQAYQELVIVCRAESQPVYVFNRVGAGFRGNKTGSAARFGGSPGPVLVFSYRGGHDDVNEGCGKAGDDLCSLGFD